MSDPRWLDAAYRSAACRRPAITDAYYAGRGALLRNLVPYIAHLEAIDMPDINRLLIAWGHKMGPCNRPIGELCGHALFAHGEPVALSVTAALVAETCAGLRRDEAIELARLCAGRPTMNRVMLRLWRELVFPAFRRPWAVSYQDEAIHDGDTYRLDGWTRLKEHAGSGTDQRSGRRGRRKTIWGWCMDEAAMLVARTEDERRKNADIERQRVRAEKRDRSRLRHLAYE